MTSRLETAEAFAYVDNCLAPADRLAFEARLREDADLRRQVALWESQNGAIRAAYGAAASARAAIDLGGNSNENFPVWMASAVQARRSAAATRANGETRAKPPRGQTAPVARAPSLAPRAPRFALARRALAIAALAAGLLVVGAPGGPTWPRGQSIDAGLAAYRAFAAASDVSVELRTSDPETLTKWLTPQFARAIAAPVFSSGALTLLGGRLTPGTAASAAFLVYENRRGEHIGLLIEPLDAPAPTRPALRQSDSVSLALWTDAGHGFVAVGRDPQDVVMLAHLVEESSAPPR